MKLKMLKLVSCLSLLAFFSGGPAMADDAQIFEMVKSMQKKIEEMQKTIYQQNQKISQLEKRPPQVQIAPSSGEAPKASPMSDHEFDDRLSNATGGANKWLKDLTFKGDMRLRYDAFTNSSGNFGEDDPRNRFRYRLRYGFEKKFNDEMLFGFSMASGEANSANGFNQDPTSPNQSFTNNFSFKNIWIEKAYATYMPNWAKVGPVTKLTVSGGKFDNPFEKGSSDMVWDRDVKPEGIYEKADFNIIPSSDVKMTGWLTAGQMPTMEKTTHTAGSSDAELFAEQIGLNTVVHTPMLEQPLGHTVAASFYGWNRYAKDSNFLIGTASLARGNSNVGDTTALDAGSFKIFELYNELALSPYGFPVRPFADFAHNMGAQNVEGSTGTHDNSAWSLGLKIGKLVKKHDWESQYQYKYIGANAVPGFNDSDFGYNGFSDEAGSVFKLGYALTDYLTLNLAAYFVHNLNADTNGVMDEQQRRFQTDLVWKF